MFTLQYRSRIQYNKVLFCVFSTELDDAKQNLFNPENIKKSFKNFKKTFSAHYYY